MKRCPTCNTTYPADGPNFCLNDGTRLLLETPPQAYDPLKTVLSPPPSVPPPPYPNQPGGMPNYQAMPPQPQYPQQPAQPQWGYPPQMQQPAPFVNAMGAARAPAGMKDKLVPALIGGLIAGIPTILPFIARGFCLWAAIGGLVAGMMYIKRSVTPVQNADGLMVGGMAGAIGAVILFVIGLPLSYATSRSGYILLANQRYGLTAFFILGGLIGAVLLVLFGAIGGLVSVPLFEKRRGGPNFPPPQPPQNFGGQYR